jgi:hypothetical protein
MLKMGELLNLYVFGLPRFVCRQGCLRYERQLLNCINCINMGLEYFYFVGQKSRPEVCLFYGQVLLKFYAYWKIVNDQNRLRVKSGLDRIVFLFLKDVRIQNFDKTVKLSAYNAF